MIRWEHGRLNLPVHVQHLLVAVLRVLVEEMLMPGEDMLHQTVLVPGPMWTERALKLRVDSTFEVVVPLQVVFVLVRFPAGGAGMLEHRGGRVLLH